MMLWLRVLSNPLVLLSQNSYFHSVLANETIYINSLTVRGQKINLKNELGQSPTIDNNLLCVWIVQSIRFLILFLATKSYNLQRAFCELHIQVYLIVNAVLPCIQMQESFNWISTLSLAVPVTPPSAPAPPVKAARNQLVCTLIYRHTHYGLRYQTSASIIYLVAMAFSACTSSVEVPSFVCLCYSSCI